jgi:phosphosulfolactate synthase (CoM biosynthesis protein A)
MTAVEFLVNMLPLIQQEGLRDTIEEALEMEKQQMLHFWQGGLLANESGGKNFETYYNETYKNNL